MPEFLENYNGMTLEIVIWSMFIGVLVATGASFYNKWILGAIVRSLLGEGADSPERAKTPRELGFGSKRLILRALRRNYALRRVVCTAIPEGQALTKENVADTGLYIPPEMNFRADMMYNQKRSDILTILIALLSFLIAAFLSLQIIPDLIELAKAVFSSF